MFLPNSEIRMGFIHWASEHYKLLNTALLVVSVMPALFASKSVILKFKQASGIRSVLALIELVVLWLLPLLTFIATEASESRLPPRSQPLAAVTALVRLELGPTGANFERQKGSPTENAADLQIGQSKHFKIVGSQITGNGQWDIFMVSEAFQKWGNTTSTEYFLEFHVVPFRVSGKSFDGQYVDRGIDKSMGYFFDELVVFAASNRSIRGNSYGYDERDGAEDISNSSPNHR